MKKFGLYAGLALGLLKYLEFYSGLYKSEYAAYTAIIPLLILALFIILAQLEQRRVQEEQISFSGSLKAGLGTAAIAALIFAIANYIFYKWVNPGIIEEYALQFGEEIRRSGQTEPEVQAQVKQYEDSYPFRAAVIILAQIVAVGAIISVLTSLFVRRG